jgi:hypothetical protein
MSVLLSFGELPVVKELPEIFYQFRFDGFPSPKRHWMFGGEIVDDSSSSLKAQDHRTMVQDHLHNVVPVVFLFEKDAPCTFKFKDLKKGYTLFVMYAERDSVRLGAESREGRVVWFCFIFSKRFLLFAFN